MKFSESAVADMLRIGLTAVAVIVIGKAIFIGYNVPIMKDIFAAV